MLLGVLHVGEAGVVVAAQQAFTDHGLGDDVDHLLPWREVDVALRRRHDPERPWLLHVPTAQQHQVLGRVEEGVDDEDLFPVALRDLVDLGVGTALDQEGVVATADPLEAVEEVGDELDLVFLDALKPHVFARRPLVAGPLGTQRHQGRAAGSDRIGGHADILIRSF